MATQPHSPARLAFGPFEVDSAAGELRKSGVRVRLSAQPFQILLVLLAHSGAVVTREQLREQIWGAGTFVDFEHGLSAAMNKLRRALGDSAGNPRYIETVPGRGYRFLASLQEETAGRPAPVALSPAGAMIQTPGAPVEEPKYRLRRKIWLIGLAAAVLAFFAGYFSHHRALQGTPKLTDKDKIILADFTNTTGDPVFDGTLRQGLAVQLAQSPFLSLVSEERIRQRLTLMGQPPDVRLTPGLAREICERTASAAVLEGSLESLGSQYVLGLRAKNCRAGEILDEEQAQAARKEDVLNALSQMAKRFRTRVGESLTTVKEHSTPLAEATTPSLEALKAYTAGRKVFSLTSSAAALPLFKRAVEIDPKFAAAYADLGHRYGEIGESDLSAESTSKAYQFRDRASDAEKFLITASYDLRVTGNMEKAQQTCEAWAQTYPREMLPHGFLGGMVYPISGRYEHAIDESSEAIRLDPDVPINYAALAANYQALNRLEEAENILQQASERKLEIPDFLIQRYDLAFLQADKAAMQRLAALAQKKSGVDDGISNHQALVLAYSGHLQRARRMSQHAVDMAQQSGQRETAALYQAAAALREALFGNAPAARQSAMAALQLSSDRETEYGAAFALALSHDSSRAITLINDLERRFGEDTSVRFVYLPTLHALLALSHNEPASAIEQLANSAEYELSTPRSSIHGNFGALYPVYVRGIGYLAAHQGVEAAAEFQKILDHRGIVVSDPIGALARLQLGRAIVLSGDKIKAKIAYREFLTLWKDADPDIPILQQANAEYAKLRLSEKAFNLAVFVIAVTYSELRARRRSGLVSSLRSSSSAAMRICAFESILERAGGTVRKYFRSSSRTSGVTVWYRFLASSSSQNAYVLSCSA